MRVLQECIENPGQVGRRNLVKLFHDVGLCTHHDLSVNQRAYSVDWSGFYRRDRIRVALVLQEAVDNVGERILAVAIDDHVDLRMRFEHGLVIVGVDLGVCASQDH